MIHGLDEFPYCSAVRIEDITISPFLVHSTVSLAPAILPTRTYVMYSYHFLCLIIISVVYLLHIVNVIACILRMISLFIRQARV